MLLIYNLLLDNAAYADSIESRISGLAKIKLSFNAGRCPKNTQDISIPRREFDNIGGYIDDPQPESTMFEPYVQASSQVNTGKYLRNLEFGIGVYGPFYLNLGMNYEKSEGRNQTFLDEDKDSVSYSSLKTTITYIGIEYSNLILNKTLLNACACWAKSRSEINTRWDSRVTDGYRGNFKSKGTGLILSSGLSFQLYKYIYLESKFGYRHINSDDIKSKYNSDWIILSTDLSGPFAAFGLGVDFR